MTATPPLKLYNTLTRSLIEFKPLKSKEVGLYTCGPTVYNYAHIGNLRTYIFEDLLKRVLIYNGYTVKHVMNITDVGHLTDDADSGEDKMEKGAKREGKTAHEIAEFYTKEFKADLAALNITEPSIWCKATDNIPEQIALIEKLEQKGFTYKTKDGIYFDTTKLPDYGKLANLKNQKLEAGSRVEMGDKKSSSDFALWKFSPGGSKRQMEWLSPWGIGFPGWHIECSAMAEKYLGVPFDIHCGGIDHVPVHHTNEIAQTEAATGKLLANVWMHGEFLLMGSDKMAKSGDNFVTLKTLQEHNISPLAYRYFLLQTHYRKQLTFSWDALEAAQNGLEHIYNQIRNLGSGFQMTHEISQKYKKEFTEKINDDLNLAQALVTLGKMLKSKLPENVKHDTVVDFERILGLGLDKITRAGEGISDEANTLISARNLARAEKNWEESDTIRKELEELGYVVKDLPDGMSVTKKGL